MLSSSCFCEEHILHVAGPLYSEESVGGEGAHQGESDAQTYQQDFPHSENVKSNVCRKYKTQYFVDVMVVHWSMIIKPELARSIMNPAVNPSTMYCWFS